MSRNSIQVAIKVRPLLTKEKDLASNWHVTGNTIGLEGSQMEPYCFDHVFDHDASNQEVFDTMAKHIVHSAVHGFNGTIFAYGQTASGKTYTMMGENNDPGVMVLAAKEVFNEIDRKSNSQFLLRGGFIEIYNEKINDLLKRTNQDLKIHETVNGNAHVNCEEVCITSEEELLRLLQLGNEARTVGETNMNERSSRSHAIFRLIIESRQTDCDDDAKVTQSVLNLVDLAGSERADQTGARGARLKEGGHINKSLLFLSNVIKRLSENEDNKYICYRDSKLTRILQASLGGNAFTSIICTVNPTSIEETQSTLSFATRAKTVKNRPRVNENPSEATMMKRLTREIKALRKELDEERRKTASQLKVAQIEGMLFFQEHKFVNSSKLHKSRVEKENRRRTWCPESINTSVAVQSTNPFKNELETSHLKPHLNALLTPLITVRDGTPENKFSLTPLITIRDGTPENKFSSDIEMLEEELEPAEFIDFDHFPIPPTTPKKSNLNVDGFMKISVSPASKNTTQHVKLLEEELESLQEFGNLEKEVGVEHDVYGSLKCKFDNMCKRNEILENERVEYLATKNELDFVKEQLHSSEMRCDQLQNQIAKLTKDKQSADSKVEQYESELFELKSKLSSIETENQQAINLQFEIDSLRNKIKLREKDLLELLEEKDFRIAELETQLKLLKSDRLQFSKEELMQLTHCTTSDSTENSCSEGSVNDTAVCRKCEDLQRLLDESKKVTLEFDQLTVQYKELQYNYQQVTADALSAQTRLAEFNNCQSEATKSNECEELRNEITELRLKLENIERDYEELKCDRDTKSENCEILRGEVEFAQEQLSMLHKKYVTLEDNWKKQEENITVIKADYDSLEKKYNELKTIYENLEHNSSKCTADCSRLQSENDGLQNEIQRLKSRIEDMQEELVDGWAHKNKFIAEENDCSVKSSDLRNESDRLKTQLNDLQTQYDQLQEEYDLMSTNIMETVQENDILISKVKDLETYKTTLEEERMNWTSERVNLEERICELQQKLEVKPLIKVGNDENDSNKNAEKGQMPLMEYVKFIELELEAGKRRTYTAIDTRSIAGSNVCYKLSLENWEGKACTSDDIALEGIECGSLEAFITCVNGWQPKCVSQISVDEQNVQHLQETIANLELLVSELRCKNESLLESSERNINELRDVIKNLTAELFEKSMVLDDLVKERAEMTLLKEELQLKIASSQNDINISSSSSTTEVNRTVCQESTENFNELSYDDALKAIKLELIGKEEECNRLKLEMLEKLELAENEFRSNLRKYNEDWEQSRLKYKHRIAKLEEILVEKGIQLSKEDNDDNEKSFDDEDNYSSFQERYKSSTPNTPPTGLSYSERYLEIQKSRMELSQMVQGCNEQLSNLITAMDEAKSENLQLSETLLEADVILQEKEAEILSLRTSLELAESKVKDLSEKAEKDMEAKKFNNEIEMSNSRIHDLDKKFLNLKIEKEDRELEIIKLTEAIEETKSRARELEEKTASLEDNKALQLKKKDEEISQLKISLTETEQKLCRLQESLTQRNLIKNEIQDNLTRLQSEHDILLGERNELCAKVEELKEQNKAYETKLNGLLSENQELQSKLYELSESSRQAEPEKVVEATQKELVDMKESNEKLEQMLEKLQIQHKESQQEIENLKGQIETLSEVDGERSRLQAKLIVLKSEFAKLEEALHKKKAELMQELEECKIERNEMKEKSETLNLKMESMAQELHESKRHSASLEKTLQEYDGMEQKMEVLSQSKLDLELEVTSLREELRQLKDAANVAPQSDNNTVEKLQTQLSELQAADIANTDQQNALRQQIIELKAEICEERKYLQRGNDELQSQIKELQLKCTSLKKTNELLVIRNKAVNEQLSNVQSDAVELAKTRERLNGLQDEKQALQARIETLVDENEKGSKTLQMKLEEQEKVLKNLRAVLNSKEAAFESNKLILEGTIANLRSENKNINERLNELQDEKRALQSRIETLVAENEKGPETLQIKLEEQEKVLRNLRAVLNSKEAAFESKKLILEGTIASLQSENKNITDRLEFVNELLTKRTDVSESANNSLESSTQLPSSPLAHWSPIKTMTNVNAEDKISSIQKERKIRRLSTHDENRRQSAKFKISVDASTITEPVMNDCECKELREKLKEVETQLFIRQSQVTALNLELRNHPLKAEKLTLVKRIQEEQEKYRIEMKKYKTKISEQAAKIQSLIDQANQVATTVATVNVATVNQSTCTSPHRNIKVAETQTDMAIDHALQKLQGKYNDIKKICLFRHNRIVSLEKMLEEKENMCGQYTAANQQNQRVLTADTSSQKISNEKRK